ncbi:MAG: ATP synthase F1 subunit delta [Planctomycetota bacterium]
MIGPVAGRYAEALFRLSKTRGVLEVVRADVERLAAAVRPDGALASAFDERIVLEQRRTLARSVTAGLSALTQDFVELLFDKRRVEVLRELGPAFHRRMLEERGAAEGVVESARPLADADLAELARALGPKLGKELTLRNRTVPELVGGVRVLVGSKMIDASVRGRLEGLRKDLLAAPLPERSGS